MDSCISAVPQISISPAPPSGPLFEPFSPFDSQPSSPAVFQDSYRPALLSPPPTISPRLVRQSSPLRPVDVNAKGLDSDRFEALLASTRERNAASGGKKALDLRKEIALKAHKSKQSMCTASQHNFITHLFGQWSVVPSSCLRCRLPPHRLPRLLPRLLRSRRPSSTTPCRPQVLFRLSRSSRPLGSRKVLRATSIRPSNPGLNRSISGCQQKRRRPACPSLLLPRVTAEALNLCRL